MNNISNTNNAIDLSNIYSLRNDFTVIGLTGQIGSGCSEVAEQLTKGFNKIDFDQDPIDLGFDEKIKGFKHNSYRKYRIIYNYAEKNFKRFSRISYKDVLLSFILQYGFEKFIQFLRLPELKKAFESIESKGLKCDFENEISELQKLKAQFDDLSEKFQKIEIENIKGNGYWEKLYEFYFDPSSKFLSFCIEMHTALLISKSRIKRNKLLQIISINLRKSGNPYEFIELSADKAFTIVERIKYIIKSHRVAAPKNEEDEEKEYARTQIVIDDLRNPIEIMYFKQRFAAYYTIAVNRDDDSREIALTTDKYKSPDTKEIREPFWEEEYNGAKSNEFYKPNISACIEQADIHITFLTKEDAIKKNKKLRGEEEERKVEDEKTVEVIKENKEEKKIVPDNTSPYFSWKIQLLKYVSLISHPGLITPSPEERCMQMAYTAKHNSGCISRQIGAAITDENYSIKALGWNNTPEGLVPCVLRSVQDYINFNPKSSDYNAFTEYERSHEFRKELEEKFIKGKIGKNETNLIELNKDKLKGRNTCFCFKDVINSFPSKASKGKNQVHTRSLHAEESAFLQLAKYGGVGIQNGKLFTTASPCELCAKKAYQLGIKVIYYIDPYPGISLKQILSSGSKPIEVRLFNGAIGNAYHWLYDPIMPYKDELTLLLGNKFDDYATQQKKKADNFEKENAGLKKLFSVLGEPQNISESKTDSGDLVETQIYNRFTINIVNGIIKDVIETGK